MTSTSDAMNEAPSVAVAGSGARVRPFLWSVRRELWENRAIYIAPLIAAAVVVAGALLAALRLGHAHIQNTGDLPPEAVMLIPFGIAAGAITVTGALVGIFYCLGALNGERRDRSILFWKSLPVSNMTTVASKVFATMVILPICIFATIVVTHLVVLVIAAANFATHGEGLDRLADMPLPRLWLILAWGLFATSLWWAPVWGWLLLASAWAKRMTFLWGVLPPIGLIVFERLAFDSGYVAAIIRNRLSGSLAAAFQAPPQIQGRFRMDVDLPHPDPIGFFTSPGLWIGLAVAIAFLAAAVWLRRRAEPV